MTVAAERLERSSSWLPAGRAALLAVAVVAAAWVRGTLNGDSPPQAFTAGLAFGIALLGLAAMTRWRPERLRLSSVAIGAAGGLVLLAVPVLLHAAPRLGLGVRPEPVLAWLAVTILVASAEEVVLRGVLLDAFEGSIGPTTAVAVTSLLFGLIHVPLYGWSVVPLDVAAGVWLAGLRQVSGGVTAPVIAHILADLATRWL